MARGSPGAVLTRPGVWTDGTGREADIALTTRARIARNCAGIRFVAKAEPAELERVVALVREWTSCSENSRGLSLVTLAGTTKAFRSKLISSFIIGQGGPRAEPQSAAISPDDTASVLINHEDHLRVQVTEGGLCARRVTAAAEEIEESLARRIEFARNHKFGHLTTSVANSGTGLRVSVMLHLAALRIEEKIPSITESARRLNVAVRGAFGEGSLPLGDLFQVSNAGPTREGATDISGRVESVADHLVREERSARGRLVRHEREAIARNARRALAELTRGVALRPGRQDLTEAMRLWSAARLGVELQMLSEPSRRETNKILAQILTEAQTRS